MSAAVDYLDGLDWRDDRIVLDGLVLRLQNHPGDPELEVESLAFFKSRAIIDEYRRVLAARPSFEPKRIFEIGIWDGGSVVFWYEVFRPQVLVAVDLADREDNPLLQRYLARRGATSSVRTYWRTNQADRQRLHATLEDVRGRLDLVVDDGSHLYLPTRSTFEALFPFVRSGGLYVIEDWPWGHLSEYRESSHPWVDEIPLTRFVHDLVELQGSSPGLVANIDINHAFVAVERGHLDLADPEAFRLDSHIRRSE